MQDFTQINNGSVTEPVITLGMSQKTIHGKNNVKESKGPKSVRNDF